MTPHVGGHVAQQTCPVWPGLVTPALALILFPELSFTVNGLFLNLNFVQSMTIYINLW